MPRGIFTRTEEHKHNISLALIGNSNGKHANNFNCICKRCSAPFLGNHRADCFCTVQCGDWWAYHRGDKGKNVRAKCKARRDEQDEKTGTCALCKVPWNEIVLARDLGCAAVNVMGGRFHNDHILAKSKGGTDDESNLRKLCWFCNTARKDMSPKYDYAIARAGAAFWAALVQ